MRLIKLCDVNRVDPIFDKCFELAKLVEPIRSARIIAVVARHNRIISIAHNVRKSDPLQKISSSVICKNCQLHKNYHYNNIAYVQVLNYYGCNNFVSNTERIYLHAETLAIKRAKRYFGNLKDCVLYVVRVKKSSPPPFWFWMFGSAKPCPSCQDLIESEGIREVRYT